MELRNVKILLIPTKEQRQKFYDFSYYADLMYNQAIDWNNELYDSEGIFYSKFDLINMLPAFKEEHPEFASVDSFVLKTAVTDFRTALNRMKHGAKYEEVISIKSVADEFMSEFKEYLLNGSYGQSEKEAQLIKMKLNNCNSEEIMKHLNYTNQSSVRSSIARLTNKVYRHVFNKETILKGLDELSSVETLRKGIMCIRTARFKFDMSDAFPLEFREQIRGRSERTRVRANSFDKNEVLKVIRFLATYSSDVFTANLNDLDKNALTYVLRALNQPKDAPNTQPNYMYHLLISNPAWLLDYSEEKLEGLMKDGASDFNSVRKNMKD